MTWSFPKRVSPDSKTDLDPAAPEAMDPAAASLRGKPPKPSAKPDEDDEDGEGKSGSGGGSPPQLKPVLAEDGSGLSSGDEGSGGSGGKSGSAGGSGEPPPPDASCIFGPWEFHARSIMLYNRAHKRRMMLEQLDSPSKLMKVIVALGAQNGWDVDNLVKSMDHAARQRFGKTLYQVFSHVQDTATIDWKKGSLKPEPEAPRPPGKMR